MDFADLVDHCVNPPPKPPQKKTKKRQILGLYQRTEKVMEHESDGDTNCKWNTWNDPQRIVQGIGRVENRWTNRDHQNYSITKIGQNTEKSPGDLRRLAVTQFPTKDYQVMLVSKNFRGVK